MTARLRGRAITERNRRILANCPVCWICGEPIDLSLKWPDPMCGVVDHKTSLHRGGTEDPSNHASAHNRCNRDKSDKPYGSIIRRSGSLERPTAARPDRDQGVAEPPPPPPPGDLRA